MKCKDYNWACTYYRNTGQILNLNKSESALIKLGRAKILEPSANLE